MSKGATAATGVTTGVRTDETDGMTEEMITDAPLKIEVIMAIAVTKETMAITIAVG